VCSSSRHWRRSSDLYRSIAIPEELRIELEAALLAELEVFAVEARKAENESIASQMTVINERLAASNVKIESVQAGLATALVLAGDCFDGYRTAPDSVRKMFNQAFFQRIVVLSVDEGPSVEGELAEPFRTLIRSRTQEHRPVAQHGRSSSIRDLEGMTGIEPA
jgi:hypothetical protein